MVVVRHSHMDLEWLMPFGPSLRRLRSVIEEVLQGLEADPAERFTLEGVPFLDALRRGEGGDPAMGYSSPYHRFYAAGLRAGHGRPAAPGEETHRRLRDCVAAGQLELVGTYVQPDTNLPAGEALVRQGLAARQWFGEHLGAVPTVAWNMDCFGQCSQLPQILRTCGYTALLAFRAGPVGEPSVSGAPEGLEPACCFRGPDGSEVLTHVLPMGYSPGTKRSPRAAAWAAVVGRVPRAAGRLAALSGSQPVLLPLGDEFSGMLPGVETLLRRLRGAHPGRSVRLGSAREYFDELATHRADLPVHEGDLNPVYPGTHALRPEIKRDDRLLTADVLAAEALDALLAVRGAEAPRAHEAIGDAWHHLLTNQAHDSIGGCHVPEVTRDVGRRAQEGRWAAHRALTASAKALGGDVVVWNPLGWDRTDTVEVPWTGEPPTALEGPDGEVVPVRAVRGRGGLRLQARVTAPAHGYVRLRVIDGSPAMREEAGDLDALCAGGLLAKMGSDGGIEVRSGGRALVEIQPLALDHDLGNAYLPDVGGVLDTFAALPWRARESALGRTVECEGALAGSTTRVTLEQVPGRDWIGLRLEGAAIPDQSRLRLRLRTRWPVRYAVPLGEMDRTGTVAARTYVRFGDLGGVANLGVPALEIAPGRVDAVLARSVRLLSQRLPLQRLRIPIHAWIRDGWVARFALGSRPRRTGRELNQPLVGIQAGAGGRPRRVSLLPALQGPATVEVLAIKRPEAGRGLVLRVLQAAPGGAEVVFRPPAAGRVWRTDATEVAGEELVVAGGGCPVELGSWELVTLLWRPR
jgi:hypothetical protein